MKKKLLLIALFPLLTFCARAEFTGNETKDDTIEMESPSSIVCRATVGFISNLYIKGLMVGSSGAYDYVPTILSFKVLRSNDTFVLKGINSTVSNAIVDPLELTPSGSTLLYQSYTVKLLDKHCNNYFQIEAVYEQIGPMYRKVKVESSHPDISEVTGPNDNKMNIGEDYQISASLKGNSGYGFSHWTRDGVVIPDAGLDYTIRLTEDKDYDAGDTTSIKFTAHFSRDATARTVFEWTQGGSVTGWQDLGLNIPVGTRFTLTAIPEAGYQFVRWMKSSATGPVKVGTEPVYTGRVTSKEGTTYTAIFESTAQVTSVTFNNQVDDSYYLSQSFIEYTDPSGRPRTLFPSSITSYFDIKKGTPVSVNVDIRKEGEYINCFISSSDGQYFDLSDNNQIITAKVLNIEPDLDDSATITLQAGN